MKALDMARAALAEGRDVNVEDFKTFVLGGKWTLEHTGKPFDAFQARACTTIATAFCIDRGLQKSKRYGIAMGADACRVLARAWAHTMQYYLNVYCESPIDTEEPFGEDVHASYVETSELTKLSGIVKSQASRQAITELRALRC